MNRLLIISIATLIFVVGHSAQPTPSPAPAPCDGNKGSEERLGKAKWSDGSVVKRSDANLISATSTGDVFVSGYNTVFGKDTIFGQGLLWRFSDGELAFDKLPFGQIGQMQWFNRNEGIALSYGYGLFRTHDGGKNWEKIEHAEIGGPMFFLNIDLGWIFTFNEALVLLNSGTFETLGPHVVRKHASVKKMQFTTRKIGWLLTVVNHLPQLHRTVDAGRTWHRVTISNTQLVEDFTFVDEQYGFALASNRFYYTRDGGNNWEATSDLDDLGSPHSLFFLNHDLGWIIGERLCSTTNKGKSWDCSQLSSEIIGGSFRGFVFTDVRNGWLLTEKGLYFSSDGGKLWHRRQLAEICF